MASSRRRAGTGSRRALRESEARYRELSELTAAQVRGLECIGSGATLAETLAALAGTIEAFSDGMLASILLLDEDGVHLRHGAAPSLPEAYVRAIDGIAIGPDVGSCGSAAYLAQPTVASKIQSDPRWANFRELAMAHGLQACWSTPIISTAGTLPGMQPVLRHPARLPGSAIGPAGRRARHPRGPRGAGPAPRAPASGGDRDKPRDALASRRRQRRGRPGQRSAAPRGRRHRA